MASTSFNFRLCPKIVKAISLGAIYITAVASSRKKPQIEIWGKIEIMRANIFLDFL